MNFSCNSFNVWFVLNLVFFQNFYCNFFTRDQVGSKANFPKCSLSKRSSDQIVTNCPVGIGILFLRGRLSCFWSSHIPTGVLALCTYIACIWAISGFSILGLMIGSFIFGWISSIMTSIRLSHSWWVSIWNRRFRVIISLYHGSMFRKLSLTAI